MDLEITPTELQFRLESGEATVILDVREPAEFSIAHLEGSVAIPMGNIAAQLQHVESLADRGQLAVLCHHGVRSLNVVIWLRQQGIENCRSVAGGIERWSVEVDPAVPRY